MISHVYGEHRVSDRTKRRTVLANARHEARHASSQNSPFGSPAQPRSTFYQSKTHYKHYKPDEASSGRASECEVAANSSISSRLFALSHRPLNVHNRIREFFTNIRYQLRLNHVRKPLAVHLTVDFIPVTDCVKLTSFQCFLRFSAPIYSKNTVEVSLRLPDGTGSHDLVDVTLGLAAVLGFSCSLWSFRFFRVRT